ncbi:capping protein-inhibiting regulator of actin dynamics [Brachionichthys hirsutus]|uniref:capping protein-inhibiting regulator of actin dynamics n=1 Tax=Brachionichthys hirsutus TaxID=412623 RepID=UPI0036048CC7
MAAEVEVQSGQVGRMAAAGRLHLNPLTDARNSLFDVPPIVAQEPNKPVPGPKPRLTPKPFAVERNATIKPIVAPKPQPKPRPEPASLAGYKPGLPHSPNPGNPGPLSANFNRPASTSFKTSNMFATGQTTKPVVQPFKPALPLDLGDPSRPNAPFPTERQKPSNLTYSKSLKSPPAVGWFGAAEQDEEKDPSMPSKGGGAMTRAKSLGFLVEAGKEEEEQNAGAAVPLRSRPRVSRPRPVSALFLDSPTKTETPVPAPRCAARRPLSADLTAKFESIGLSLHRTTAKMNTKDNGQPEKGGRVGESEEAARSSDGDANPAVSNQTGTESDDDKPAVSIKSRIHLLLDSSSSPGASTSDLLPAVPPGSETEPPVGVRQLIKQLSADTTPAQSPTLRPLKPRPLPSDLTKMFSPERLPDLGNVSISDELHDTDPQRGRGESASGDQRTSVDSQEKPKTVPTSEGRPEAGQTFGTAPKESRAGGDVQTVRASLFENVVERHSVLMVDEGKPPKTARESLSSPSSKRDNTEDGGTVVTAVYKDPPSPSGPLRVVHAFDTVQAVEESRAVSEHVPSAQREDKAMTLRSRRSEGTKPTPERTASAAAAAAPQQQPRYLRVGALQKWTDAGHEDEKWMLAQREDVLARDSHRGAEQEEAAAAPKRLKILHAEEPLKPKATYFALTGQLQEVFPPVGAGASVADADDVAAKAPQGSAQGRRHPSAQDPVEVTRSHRSHRETRQTREDPTDVEKKRELKKEKERHKAKLKAVEKEKQRQLEVEREALSEFERMKETERQRELERQRQKAFEKEKREFEEKQRALERQKQTELHKQKALETERLEKERQRRQRELEKQRKAEREKQEVERQREQERQRQREEERQAELDRERRLLEVQREKQEMEELQRVKELETQQLLEFQRQRQREKEKQQNTELEEQRLQEKKQRDEAERVKQMALEQEALRLREIEKERERRREVERDKQKELERERHRELERQRQRQLDIERQRQLDSERQRQLDSERQRQLDIERQRQLDIERQRQLDIERQELETQRLRQRELETERQRKEELERFKESERRQLLEFEKQKQAERDRMLEKTQREEADKMRQVAKQQEAERQRLKERQREEEERSRLEMSRLRPQVVDIDAVSRNDHLPKSPPQRSDPAARWKEPSGVDAGLGARLQPERDVSWRLPQQTSPGVSGPAWTTSPQDPWDLLSLPVRPVAQASKLANRVSPEQLLRQQERLPAPKGAWSAPPDGAAGAAADQAWIPRELLGRSGGVASRQRSQGSQDLNRIRSRSVSRRSAPSGGAVEAGLSRLRSRSAHREQDRHSWVQKKQSNGVEEDRRDSGETPHQETDSQYGTWETGLRSDDSLTPATPSSDSNLSPSPRKPTPPQTPADPSSLLDSETVDIVPPPPPPSESQAPSFPDAPAALLDTSVLRSRAQLAKTRPPRTRPTKAARQTAAAPEGGAATTDDWLYRDSTEPKAESKDDGEEEGRGAESSAAVAPQPQRVALFPGVDPSALKAQLKKRGESDNQSDGPAPSPSQASRSPKSPFLPRAARVLPPPGGKEAGEEDSPQWLKELKSKKRLSQYEMES